MNDEKKVSLPIDLSAMRSFTEGDAAAEKELLELFIQQSDINLAALKAHRVDGQCVPWTEAAHMLKGGAACIGAEILRALCERAQLQEDVPGDERTVLFESIAGAYGDVKNYLVRAELIA